MLLKIGFYLSYNSILTGPLLKELRSCLIEFLRIHKKLIRFPFYQMDETHQIK